MSLHIIKDSPENSKHLTNFLRLAQDDDVLLLIENGVYAAVETLPSIAINQPCYLLKADLEARGITNEVAEHFKIVDYAGFVELTEQHKKIISW